MFFLWDANNIAHIAKHGITPELAEQIIKEGQVSRSKINCRYYFEATLDGKHYRLIGDIALDGTTIYPVTAYPIRDRKQGG